ncbi:MAG: hypothetical protein Q9170_003185 [Blastenia crenularia]
MGAVHKYDLTSDVTHLIVGDTDTPKYKFVAKERPDVKCLLPTWVEALRQLWVEDVEPDFQALESQYSLPALHNLRICVTGFEDMAYRKKLEDDVNNSGAEYRGNLTKDVTHLIAKEPSGAKYKYAIDWNIKIVAVEWLEQSLERGMILDETLYSLSLPPQDRGQNAWIRHAVSTSSLAKRPFDGEAALNGPRKLRRIASAKLNSQSVGLWSDIVSADVRVEEAKPEQWSDEMVPHKFKAEDGSSMTSRSMGTSTESSRLPPDSAASSVAPLGPPLLAHYADLKQKKGIFSSRRFVLHGFNERKTSILHKHLVSHEAEILPDLLSFTPAAVSPPGNEFLLVPHDVPHDQIPAAAKSLHQPVVVTDMWVERNLHRKQYIRPEANITNTPFRRFPIPGFDRLVICSTRFEDVDLLHMSKAVKLMGATYEEEFSPKASVLLCNKVIPGHEKLRHAQHWNVCAVTADWLWDCIQAGELKDFEPYLVQPWSSKPRSELNEIRKQPRDQASNDTNGEEIISDEGCSSRTTQHHIAPADAEKTNQDETTKPEDDEKKPHNLPPPSKLLPHPPVSTSDALREISPNSSLPKTSISPSKSIRASDPTTKIPSQDPALSSAICSLLAHHQNARSSIPNNATTLQNPTRPAVRRKRQLFGRAPSNTSNLSRASSVDTVNTDGVGTPVELTRSTSMLSSSNNPLIPHHTKSAAAGDSTFDPLAPYIDDQAGESEQQFQMTQLGYEDPEALAWRETVERKLKGFSRKEGNPDGDRRKVKEIGRVKDLTGKGRRTRQGVGR